MSTRRTLILLVAVALGGFAAFSLVRYVGGVEDQAYANARRVEVFVVRQDVPKGLPGDQAIDQQFVAADQIPQEFRPATALADLAVIRSKVTLNDLPAGTVVVDGMFVDPQQAVVTNSQRIDPGWVAITISVDDVRGVAGLVVPGDRVNLIAADPVAFGYGSGRRTEVLYQNVEVLFVGQQAAPEPGEVVPTAREGADGQAQAAQSNLLTLAVPPEAASRIAHVGSDNLYLTLVPPDNPPVAVPRIDEGNLYGGGLTPDGAVDAR